MKFKYFGPQLIKRVDITRNITTHTSLGNRCRITRTVYISLLQ